MSIEQQNILCQSIKTTLNEYELIITNPEVRNDNANISEENISTKCPKSVKKCRYYNRGFCKLP